MSWYLVVRNDRTVANPLVVDREDFRGVDPDRLKCCVPVEHWEDISSLRATNCEDDGDPDDALQNHLGLLVFSARVRAALEKAEMRGIQYLPVQVFRPDGELVPGYAIANILKRCGRLDRERSDFDVFPDDYFRVDRRGAIRSIRCAVLRSHSLRGVDIFRLDEFPERVYVSESFRRAFETSGSTGMSFIEAPTID